MRISEIIYEGDVTKKIVNDLMDFMTAYRQDGKQEIPVQGPNGVLAYLRKMNHSVTIGNLLDLVSREPFTDIVRRSDPSTIHLKPSKAEPTVSPDEMEKSQEKVEKTAASVANKMVQKGSEI